MSEIQLPEDTARRPRRRKFDDYGDDFITLEDAETEVQATGQHRGTKLTFSDDGKKWVKAWVPTVEDDGVTMRTHPTHARAVVSRKMADGDVVKTPVVVRWDEYVPDVDNERYAAWMKMPTTLLGKCAKVSGYRGAFRDIIGNRYEPAELDQASRPAAPKPHPPKTAVA